MSTKAEASSPLVPQRAFVVQFRAEADVKQRHLVGRTGYVASGQVVHFSSLEKLLTFVAQVLASVAGQSSAYVPDDS